jgi:hypothetical protein
MKLKQKVALCGAETSHPFLAKYDLAFYLISFLLYKGSYFYFWLLFSLGST